MSSLTGTTAVLLAAKYCRRNPLFKWKEDSVTCIGQRQDEKFRFWIELTNLLQEPDKNQKLLLTVLSATSSAPVLNGKKRDYIEYQYKSLLVALQHPNILPVVDFAYVHDKNAVIIVQSWIPSGSLKDYIFRNAQPERDYHEKYHSKRGTALAIQEIAKFSSQILQALRALRSIGIICENLHSGNVILDGGKARYCFHA